ncbi:hypothetical protein B566_EDAN006123 [Ephemera danica]|nr:hypothetical protein B566_EDAN006123 [Ephemera danica]
MRRQSEDTAPLLITQSYTDAVPSAMTRKAWQFVALFIAYTAIILCVQTFYMQKHSETELQHSAFLIKHAQAHLTSNDSTTKSTSEESTTVTTETSNDSTTKSKSEESTAPKTETSNDSTTKSKSEESMTAKIETSNDSTTKSISEESTAVTTEISNDSTTKSISEESTAPKTKTLCTECPETSSRPCWSGCPKPNQTLVTCGMDGRLGNLVWEYLSTWAVAQRHQLWPVIRNESLRELNNVFEDLSIPSMEELFDRCPDLGDLTTTKEHSTSYVWSRGGLNRALESSTHKMIELGYYTVLTEYAVPYWRQLPHEMRLHQELLVVASEIIRNITNKVKESNSDENQEIQFVGVHIRRTDYAHHMSSVNPNAELANASYFQHAMQWIRDKLSPQLVAFLVLSDDVEWCRENLNASDVFLPGTGNSSSPGLDLAILASCNHTILAYGTFSLTAAMLAQGTGYTLVFNTRNSTQTKVMEFASLLPYWRIMDNDGAEVSADISYEMTFIG